LDPEVDLLLTDRAMPDLFADQPVARLKEQKPSRKVIFMSGNRTRSLELGVSLEEGLNFVQKPFDFGNARLRGSVRNGECQLFKGWQY
jgi:DNA-binding NtrC family response regulator